jgi:hypothetical protein
LSRVIRWRAGLLALALAGCSDEQPAPAPSPTPQPTQRPAPAPIDPASLAPGELPAPELAGVQAAVGGWSTSPGFARFLTSDGTAAFAIRCDSEKRQLILARSGAADAGEMLRIVTGMAAASYPTTPVGRRVEARVSIDDRFVAALAKAKGPVGISVGEGPVLMLAPDPAIARVIRGCDGR